MNAEVLRIDSIQYLIELSQKPKYNYIELNMLIAANIIVIYTDNGMNKEAFRKKVGVGKARIDKWLSGTHSFNTKEIAKIASALGVNFRHLTLQEDERKIINQKIR